MTERPLRVLRLINGLLQGGAEESLRKVTATTKSDGIECVVVSFGKDGPLRSEIERAGARVYELAISPLAAIAGLRQLLTLVREWQPDVLEGWMIHANIVAYFLRWMRRDAIVVWNVRASYGLTTERLFTRFLTRLSVVLSSRVNAIVFNSARAAQQYQAAGYSRVNCHVIPNGFDASVFSGGRGRRSAARTKVGLSESICVVGHVSRWHPDKDHATLLDAFAHVRQHVLNAVLVLAGRELETTNEALMEAIARRGLKTCVVLLGNVRPVAELYPAFDVFVLTSTREGFPNVLGEALASGIPCVATDVGDCRVVLGAEWVALPGDALAIAEKLLRVLCAKDADRQKWSDSGRQRVESMFSVEALHSRYAALYASLR